MAIRLDQVSRKSDEGSKSLLDMVLDRKEQKNKAAGKKKSLRPWQNFQDEAADDRYYKKKSSVMKPFHETQLTEDEKLEIQIKERAHELFSKMDKTNV